MTIPLGFTTQWEPRMASKLKKALYGLKQSPLPWFGKYSKAILALGYKRSSIDHTLHVRKLYGSTAIILYVGEIIITGDSIEQIYKVKGYFSKVFKIKDLGPINYSLSIEISRSHKEVAIFQHKYVIDLLNQQGHLDVNQLIL